MGNSGPEEGQQRVTNLVSIACKVCNWSADVERDMLPLFCPRCHLTSLIFELPGWDEEIEEKHAQEQVVMPTLRRAN
jgi:hypothetical protein